MQQLNYIDMELEANGLTEITERENATDLTHNCIIFFIRQLTIFDQQSVKNLICTILINLKIGLLLNGFCSALQ